MFRRALGRLAHREVSLAWQEWQEDWERAQAKAAKLVMLRRAVGRLAHRDLGRAWQAWRADSRRAQAKSAEADRHRLHCASKRVQALERHAEAAALEMEQQRRLYNREMREMAERLAKAERIAERERLYRVDLERELIRAGGRVRSPRRG